MYGAPLAARAGLLHCHDRSTAIVNLAARVHTLPSSVARESERHGAETEAARDGLIRQVQKLLGKRSLAGAFAPLLYGRKA